MLPILTHLFSHWSIPLTAGKKLHQYSISLLGKNNARIRIHLTIKVDSGYSSVSVADPGCLSPIQIFSIPDPNFFYPGSAPKNSSILTQKLFLSFWKYDPGCSLSDPDFLPFPDPGVRNTADTS